MARLRFDLELTDRILEINEEIKKNSNYFANSLTLNSEICPGQKWNYVGKGDSYSLSFSKDIDWSKVGDVAEGTLFLPQSHSSTRLPPQK